MVGYASKWRGIRMIGLLGAAVRSLALIGAGLALGCGSGPYDPFVESGAADRYPDYVPPSAMLMASGPGDLSMIAPTDGIAYFLNGADLVRIPASGMKRLFFDEPFAMKPRLIRTFVLKKGAKLAFDAETGRVTIDKAEESVLSGGDPSDDHEFFFDPAVGAD